MPSNLEPYTRLYDQAWIITAFLHDTNIEQDKSKGISILQHNHYLVHLASIKAGLRFYINEQSAQGDANLWKNIPDELKKFLQSDKTTEEAYNNAISAWITFSKEWFPHRTRTIPPIDTIGELNHQFNYRMSYYPKDNPAISDINKVLALTISAIIAISVCVATEDINQNLGIGLLLGSFALFGAYGVYACKDRINPTVDAMKKAPADTPFACDKGQEPSSMTSWFHKAITQNERNYARRSLMNFVNGTPGRI